MEDFRPTAQSRLDRVRTLRHDLRMSLPVIPIDHLAFAFEPRPWRFAEERRAEIDAHFAARRAQRPQIWNGRVVLASRYSIDDARLAGRCFETDFASFLAWRDWGFPAADANNVFAMGALRSRDGAFLLGVMGAHTVNAGRIYFPAGTPEPEDVADGALDLAGNVVREVAEETGLTSDDYAIAPGWHAIPAGLRLALMKVLDADATALDLQRRMREHIARDKHPELSDIRIVRGPTDFDPMMPPFVTAFLSHALRNGI
jgi:8-oxo-dGTP pyrophosphatase MutT (NUDIX family)